MMDVIEHRLFLSYISTERQKSATSMTASRSIGRGAQNRLSDGLSAVASMDDANICGCR